jgi:hypothetical protein
MEQMHAEERHVWAYKNMCRREVVQAKARGRWLRRALAWRVDSARIYNVANAEANSTTFKKEHSIHKTSKMLQRWAVAVMRYVVRMLWCVVK